MTDGRLRPAPRLVRRRLHRLDRRDGGPGLRGPARGAVPRPADAGAARRRFAGLRGIGVAGDAPGDVARSGWTSTCRRSSTALRTARRADRPLQDLLDLRLVARGRHHRPGDRHRPAGARRRRSCRWSSPRPRSAAGRPSATCSPRVGAETYRLDRHPTMQRHPVTPMDEADVRAPPRPADRREPSASWTSSLSGPAAAAATLVPDARTAGHEIVVFDVLDERDAGRRSGG